MEEFYSLATITFIKHMPSFGKLSLPPLISTKKRNSETPIPERRHFSNKDNCSQIRQPIFHVEDLQFLGIIIFGLATCKFRNSVTTKTSTATIWWSLTFAWVSLDSIRTVSVIRLWSSSGKLFFLRKRHKFWTTRLTILLSVRSSSKVALFLVCVMLSGTSQKNIKRDGSLQTRSSALMSLRTLSQGTCDVLELNYGEKVGKVQSSILHNTRNSTISLVMEAKAATSGNDFAPVYQSGKSFRWS